MANAVIRVMTWLCGSFVGQDSDGNKYYQEHHIPRGRRRRRWVIYANKKDEASAVPPEFHAWLHYTIDHFPQAHGAHSWMEPHISNQTGSEHAWRPPGHTIMGARRPPASGDYDPWIPE